MQKLALALAVACGVLLLGQTSVDALDVRDIKRQQKQLVVNVNKEKQSLRRATTLEAVARSATVAGRQFENLARTIAGIPSDRLLAIFLKLNINDPNNAAAAQKELQRLNAHLRKLAIAMAQEANRRAAAAQKDAHGGDAAEEIANAVEDLMEEAEKVVKAIMRLFGM